MLDNNNEIDHVYKWRTRIKHWDRVHESEAYDGTERSLRVAKRTMASVNLSSVSLCEEDIPGASFCSLRLKSSQKLRFHALGLSVLCVRIIFEHGLFRYNCQAN